MQPKIRSAILCDLVRTENTGKHILIGVYSGDMIFGELPTTLPCAFYIEIAPDTKNQEVGFEARIELPGHDKPAELRGTMSVKEETSVLLILAIPNLPVLKEGDIRMSMSFNGGAWVEALTKRAVVRQSSLPTA